MTAFFRANTSQQRYRIMTTAFYQINVKHLLWLVLWLHWKSSWQRHDVITFLNRSYYSFKIFPQFWLAKSVRLIHHNQLPMTKFGRILCLTGKWRQKCSLLQVKAPLPRRPEDEVDLFWLRKKKMADFSLVSRVKTAGTRRNNN